MIKVYIETIVFNQHFNQIIIFLFLFLYTFSNAKIVYRESIMKQRRGLILKVIINTPICFIKELREIQANRGFGMMVTGSLLLYKMIERG